MAREGQHDAQLRIRGDASSADKELRQLAGRMNQLETATEKQNNAFGRMSAKQKQLDTDLTKSGQQFMETRGRVLGFAGAIAGSIIALDTMARRARELQPEVKGLANTWVTAADELKATGERLITTIDKLPLAIRTVREEMGLLDDVAEEQAKDVGVLSTVWNEWLSNLSPIAGKDWLPAQGVNALADAVDNLTANVAKPALATGMDNLIKAAKELEARGLVATMNRQNEDMKRSISMLEANARSAEIVQSHLDRRRPSSSAKKAAAPEFGEAFEFTANDIDEMQGGARADREDLAANADQRLEELRDFNQRRIELEFEAEMQRIAMKEELGVLDPMDAVALERDAQLQHIDQLRQTTSDEIELQRLKTQEELVYHNAHIRRSELRRAQQQKELATVRTITQTIGGILQGGAQTAAMASDLFIQGEQRKEKARYAMGATMAFITGVVEQVEAIAAFASFNYVQGALHQAAAIFAFAQGGMLAAKAGGAGSSSTGGAAAMGGGAGMGGGSGGMGGMNVASNRPQGETAIPVSPGSSSTPAANDDPSTKDTPHRTGGRRGSVVVNINARVIDRQAVREIKHELDDLKAAEGG